MRAPSCPTQRRASSTAPSPESAPSRQSSATPWITVTGVRSSWEASATKRRRWSSTSRERGVAYPGRKVRRPATHADCDSSRDTHRGRAGLWGGSVLRGSQASTSATTGAAAARAAFSRAGGTGAQAEATSTATTGTVTDIIGNTLYVTNSSGQLIKVTLSSSATVTRNSTSALSVLKPGDTVTVQGTTPKSGSMTASSVAATAKGVSSSAGFGAGRGFGGASAAG